MVLITIMNNMVIIVLLGAEFRDVWQNYLFIIYALTLVTGVPLEVSGLLVGFLSPFTL